MGVIEHWATGTVMSDALNFSFKAPLMYEDSSLLWHFFIEVPPDMRNAYRDADVQRIICTIDHLASIHCAIMPGGDNRWFIMINKEVRSKLDWQVGQARSIVLTPDTSPYGMELAVELQSAFEAYPLGSQYFHALTPGKQRNLIHIASTPKQSETRLKKSITIMEYLERSKGELDFKALNAAFKEANRNWTIK